MGEEMEKPNTAVGQRWKVRDTATGCWEAMAGKECVVTRKLGAETFEVEADDGTTKDCGLYMWAVGSLVGGPTPALGVPVVMGENARGEPLFCLACGGDKGGCGWVCDPCVAAGGIVFMDQWEKGARDFPRPAPATPQPEAPCKHGVTLRPGWQCFACSLELARKAAFEADAKAFQEQQRKKLEAPPAIPASKPLPVNPRHAMEQQRNGVALSALEHIKARKPPEPYIPSIDEWDLLPDAGR